MVMIGELNLDREQELVHQTKIWLLKQAESNPIYTTYLNAWGDWESPWGSN